MIPQEKIAAVTRAMREAFGVREFEDIQRLTRGNSPGIHVFRIVVGGSRFLLRIIMRTDDPTRHFSCMRAAAQAGLAPRVRYTSVEDRISITDFVEEVPCPPTEALAHLPRVLRTLHSLPPFPRIENHLNTTCMFLIHQGPVLDGFMSRFRTSGFLSSGESEALWGWHAQLVAAYPYHDPQMVPSHNDLFKPDNILFDGHKVWLVDWECAFLNDRYADLAAVASLVITNAAEEEVYLRAYFGQAPTEYQRARFFFMRQLVHIFYTLAFLFVGAQSKVPDAGEKAPDFNAFHRSMWAGEINLSDSATKIACGRVHWERLTENMRQPRWRETLQIMSGKKRLK